MANNLSFNLDRSQDSIKRIERNEVSAGRKIRATNCVSSAVPRYDPRKNRVKK